MLLSVYSTDGFTLEYQPEQHLLIGRWLRAMTLPELQAVYENLLAAARAHDNCRHWLLDMRRRGVGDEAALRWFGQDYGPQLVPALGGPVSIAYFGIITQAAATTTAILSSNIAEGAVAGAHYRYYNREDEALAWLNQQP